MSECVCKVTGRGAWINPDCLTHGASNPLAARVAELEEDVADAAGELLVEIPEVGSDARKLLLANRTMRSTMATLEAERDDLKDQLELAEVGAYDKIKTAQRNKIERLQEERDRLAGVVEAARACAEGYSVETWSAMLEALRAAGRGKPTRLLRSPLDR